MLVDPGALLTDAPQVRFRLSEAGWGAAALEELLGLGYRTNLARGELAPLLRRTAGRSPLAQLARALVVGGPVDPGVLPESWVGAGGRALLRLQVVEHGGREVTVPHDPGNAAAAVAQEQVLGVGAASLTLAAATPRESVRRCLDIGAGAGIQALLASAHSGDVVATDRNPRAVAFSRLAAALGGIELDAREGSLLDPVAGESFDLVVSNPPFVISSSARSGARVASRYTYRDGGLAGDDLCRRLVADIPTVLAPGGHAVLLVNWLHLDGEDGDVRIRSWFDGLGCDAWVVQREVAEPEEYVTAWLRDTDEGAFDEQFDPWVQALAGVDAVAFGLVALHRRTDSLAPLVTLDEVEQPVAATWGEEVLAHFARRGLLEGNLLAARLRLRGDVRLHQVATRSAEGWLTHTQVLQQEAGLRWSGEVDAYGATLLAACDGTVPLGQLIALLAGASGLAVGETTEQVLPVVRRLVEQGYLGVA